MGNGKSVNGGPGGGRSEGKETNLQLFGAETPPPQIRNCCGRITSRVHKQRSDEEGDVVDSQLELGSGSSSSITGGGGGVKRDSKDQELEEDLELVSLQSNVSSSTTTTTQPDPLSPGLVLMLLLARSIYSLFLSKAPFVCLGHFSVATLIIFFSFLHRYLSSLAASTSGTFCMIYQSTYDYYNDYRWPCPSSAVLNISCCPLVAIAVYFV